MYSIYVDYTLLRNRLDRLSELVAATGEEIGKIAEYTANLDIFWDGDANSAYILRISEDLIDIDVIMMRIRETVHAAVSAFDMYQENERRISRMIGEYRI